jgi:hypothetical protein
MAYATRAPPTGSSLPEALRSAGDTALPPRDAAAAVVAFRDSLAEAVAPSA